MKKLIAVLILAAASCAAQSDSAAPEPNVQSTDSQIAKNPTALVQKMIKALGGDAYLSYQTMEQEGRSYSFFHGEANNAGVRFWRFWKYPDKDRVEVTKERDVVYINNGDKGYEVTYKGTAAQEAKDLEDYLRRRDHSLEIVLREWLKDPKTIILYVGSSVADQKFVQQVSILNSKNDEVVLAIDPLTNLPVRKSFSYKDTDKYKSEEVDLYANYRSIQGIMTALTLTHLKNGDTTNQRFLSAVRYNTEIADAQFETKVNYDPYKLPSKKK